MLPCFKPNHKNLKEDKGLFVTETWIEPLPPVRLDALMELALLYNICLSCLLVLMTKVNGTNQYVNGDKRLKLPGMMNKLYKGNRSTFLRYGNPAVIWKSECGCKVGSTVGRAALIMGVTDRYINYVTYIAMVTDDRKFRRSLKEMRRGFDCTKYQVTPVYKDWSAIALRNPDEM